MLQAHKINTLDDFGLNERSLIRTATQEMVSLMRAEEEKGTTYRFNEKSNRLTLGKIVHIRAYKPIELAQQAIYGAPERMNMTLGAFNLNFNDMALAIEREAARQMGYIPAEP